MACRGDGRLIMRSWHLTKHRSTGRRVFHLLWWSAARLESSHQLSQDSASTPMDIRRTRDWAPESPRRTIRHIVFANADTSLGIHEELP